MRQALLGCDVASGAAAAELREVCVLDAGARERSGEGFAIELRIAARAGEAADVGDAFDLVFGEQGEEVGERMIGVAYGEEGGHLGEGAGAASFRCRNRTR